MDVSGFDGRKEAVGYPVTLQIGKSLTHTRFMDTWTPLWSKIVDSSIWCEPDTVRIVFITMLALKDSDHVVRHSAFQLGQRAKKTEDEVLKALKVLSSPDKKRLEPQPYDGRRIQRVEDGWLMLNGEEYRKKVSDEMRKARIRRAQSSYRQKHKVKKEDKPASAGYKAREAVAVKVLEAGDEEGFERMAGM